MKTNFQIHIVSFDVPFPPNYGGVIDVYNRAKALKDAGFYVVLHCFEYGRGRQHDFKNCANELFYYERKSFFYSFLKGKAYITESRNSLNLIERLNQSESDLIILEGQHCSAIIPFLKRKAVVRIHNCEWEYYTELAKKESSFFKRIYFKREVNKLKKEEIVLQNMSLLCITQKEVEYYTKQGFVARYCPPVFDCSLNKLSYPNGDYLLFHGNLSVQENCFAVEQLMEQNRLIPFSYLVKIAGKSPSKELVEKIKDAGFELIDSPSELEMAELQNRAKAHVLLSNQATGLKMKLLYSLCSNRPVIVNQVMVEGTDLGQYCFIWNGKKSLSNYVDEVLLQETKKVDLAEFQSEKYVKLIREYLE